MLQNDKSKDSSHIRLRWLSL